MEIVTTWKRQWPSWVQIFEREVHFCAIKVPQGLTGKTLREFSSSGACHCTNGHQEMVHYYASSVFAWWSQFENSIWIHKGKSMSVPLGRSFKHLFTWHKHGNVFKKNLTMCLRYMEHNPGVNSGETIEHLLLTWMLRPRGYHNKRETFFLLGVAGCSGSRKWNVCWIRFSRQFVLHWPHVSLLITVWLSGLADGNDLSPSSCRGVLSALVYVWSFLFRMLVVMSIGAS